ncbi:MAG: hypothetical protein L0H36_01255 [bacterium]|nr:hypothetical protein [bacterium]MDN5835245.1 hypothetical protein [bacterium]
MTDTRASKRQQELLQFVDNFIQGHGYGPSYREVMRSLGYKSVSTVATHINGLIAKGYLEKRDNSARSLHVLTTKFTDDTPTGASPKTSLEQELTAKIDKRLKQETPDVAALDHLIESLQVLGYDSYDDRRAKLDDIIKTK